MRKGFVLIALVMIAILAIGPGVACAATSPANGTIVHQAPVTLSIDDLPSSYSAKFYIDGVLVATKATSKNLVWDGEDYYINGYRASASVVAADGPHTLVIKQGTATRYSGTFTMDAVPVLVDYWWGGDGMYFKVVDNDPAIVANIYSYDTLTLVGSAPNVSSSTQGGLTTVVRKAPHNNATNMIGEGYCCEIHGWSVKLADEGGQYPGDTVHMGTFDAYAVDEPMCVHYGGYGDPETMYEHNIMCLGLNEW